MRIRFFILLAACFLRCGAVDAQSNVSFAPPGDESAAFETDVLLSGLDNPTGITLREANANAALEANAARYELFVAESGAARVLRVSAGALEQGAAGERVVGATSEVIVGFPRGTFGQQPEFRVGPLALAFVTRTKLAVSAKGEGPGNDFVAGYVLPSDGTSISATTQDHRIGPLEETFSSQVDQLCFGSMAMGERMCYLTTGGGSKQGWVLKSGVEANRLAYLQAFIDVQSKAGYGAPTGIAVIPDPRPPYLVVGLEGSRDAPNDSRLAYFEPASGELALSLPTGLHDVISLAYSPSGQLYAADFSWQDAQAGGVYRLDDARLEGRQTCRAVKIAALVRPYGMAFAPDGSLLVTAFGEGENDKRGSLTRITGDF